MGGPDAAVIKGALDESNAKWWALWRRRVKKESARAVADAIALDNGSDADDDDEELYKKKSGSRKRAVNGEKKPKSIKKEQQQDADVSMLADNEFEPDEEKETKQTKKRSYWGDTEAFKPLAVHEIKLDEQAMHEDMRILIKVSLRCSIHPTKLLILPRAVGHHCGLDQARRPVRMGSRQPHGIARGLRRGLHARVGAWW